MSNNRGGRPAWAEIDLDAIAHNIKELKALVVPNTLFMAVIKADGYGHGAIQVAKVALENGADYLAVAILDEALQLREAGIKAPILVLGYTPEEQFGDLIDHDITQTIFSVDTAKSLDRLAIERGKKVKVHIKIDTGMGRLGFAAEKPSVKEVKKFLALPNLEIEGIYTHFSVADEKNKVFTFRQLNRFTSFCNLLDSSGIDIKIKHASNSAGIIDVPEANLNMVRAGISIYGLYPSNEVYKERVLLKPALSLKAKISYIKTIPEGSTVSYGRKYEAEKEIKVATIPMGYADGYRRLLSNQAMVLVQGQKVPVIGNICMDQFMIDVTSVDQVKQGDEVVLVGKQGDQQVTTEDLADLCGTINYEIITGISPRIPRFYKESTY